MNSPHSTENHSPGSKEALNPDLFFIRFERDMFGQPVWEPIIQGLKTGQIKHILDTGPSGSGKSYTRRLLSMATNLTPITLLTEPHIQDVMRRHGIRVPSLLGINQWDEITARLGYQYKVNESIANNFTGVYTITEIPTNGGWMPDIPENDRVSIKNRGMSLLYELGDRQRYVQNPNTIFIRRIPAPPVIKFAIATRSDIPKKYPHELFPYLNQVGIRIHPPNHNSTVDLYGYIQAIVNQESRPDFLQTQDNDTRAALSYWYNHSKDSHPMRWHYYHEAFQKSTLPELRPFYATLSLEETDHYAQLAGFYYTQALEMGWKPEQIFIVMNAFYPPDDAHPIHWFFNHEPPLDF